MHSKVLPFSCGPECKLVNVGRWAHTEENSALGWKKQHWNLEWNETKKHEQLLNFSFVSSVFSSNSSFTKSGLHWVDDMCKAVGVKYISTTFVVVAWVDAQHSIV